MASAGDPSPEQSRIVDDTAGDPVCWLDKVCPTCGLLTGTDETVVSKPTVQVRRIYDEPNTDDGTRVLVDRLWPRGMSKARAQLDEWCRTVAPSTELRTWYHHEPERFDEFTRRYLEELASPERTAALAHLRDIANRGLLTLLTATKAPNLSEAAVLATQLRAPGIRP